MDREGVQREVNEDHGRVESTGLESGGSLERDECPEPLNSPPPLRLLEPEVSGGTRRVVTVMGGRGSLTFSRSRYRAKVTLRKTYRYGIGHHRFWNGLGYHWSNVGSRNGRYINSCRRSIYFRRSKDPCPTRSLDPWYTLPSPVALTPHCPQIWCTRTTRGGPPWLPVSEQTKRTQDLPHSWGGWEETSHRSPDRQGSSVWWERRVGEARGF